MIETPGFYPNLTATENLEILILDEPVNGLDPIGVMETRNFIRGLSQDYGKTILLSSF